MLIPSAILIPLCHVTQHIQVLGLRQVPLGEAFILLPTGGTTHVIISTTLRKDLKRSLEGSVAPDHKRYMRKDS